MWYAKLASIERKFFTEWRYANSHPSNQYQTYQSHHANGNQTRKLSLSMMIYTPEHGSVTMTGQNLTAIAIIWYHPFHPKSQYHLNKQPMRTTPGTIQEDSSEILPHTDEIDDGTDTDHYMQPDADNSVEQIDPTPTNPRSSEYDLRHNPRPNCNDDYRY